MHWTDTNLQISFENTKFNKKERNINPTLNVLSILNPQPKNLKRKKREERICATAANRRDLAAGHRSMDSAAAVLAILRKLQSLAILRKLQVVVWKLSSPFFSFFQFD
jgi:hypothetical protein